MKAFKLNGINKVEKGHILTLFANDIRLGYEYDIQEYWIGEKGTTDLMLFTWFDNDEGEIISFGKTIDELRKDTTFFRALLTDGDVNHGLSGDYAKNEEELKEILDWVNGETNEMFITSCGVTNYYDSYLS